MKVIIPLAGFGTRMRPHTWSRPKALLHVAGNTVIGHLLDLMKEITTEEVIFVVGYKGHEIEAWLLENYPHLNSHFVVQEKALGQAHALWLCREFMDETAVLVAFGDGVVEADYVGIEDTDADAAVLVQEVDDPSKFGVAAVDGDGIITRLIEKPTSMAHRLALAGVYWFRHGNDLKRALDTVIEEKRMTKGEYYIADAYQVLLEEGFRITTKPTISWLDAGNPENILHTNTRLLGRGHGSENAIERSYGEDFTVIPPVYLHETAVIDSCVIGPYVSVGPKTTLKNVIVRNSIIDGQSQVENAILDGALIGEKVIIEGRAASMFVGDNSELKLG